MLNASRSIRIFSSSYVTAAGRVSRGAILGCPADEAMAILGSIIAPAAEMH